MASLSNLTLHSPSAQIIGTPFATNNAPFEYPFPVTPSATSTNCSSPVPVSAFRPPSPGFPPPFPTFATSSCTLSDPTNTLALSLSMAIPTELPNPQLPINHPKMRMTPPPIPPGLMKRRKEKLQMRRGSGEFVRPHLDVLQHSASDSDLKAKATRPPSGLDVGMRLASS
ncbi:hypothetical protein CC1G_06177 [Coprinopsis cinerea okayama7|uniref:Uncharacterized protein n=1 Tax=Coprinopsis cinerea (strain Okayama-7 / 130 / ATCC MYA-4618 / FGSC 9003) TaxID=240176 RepID=A8NV33_COPC7|nr:hypothetical protein CC1G_06177 [Coprinopsis cinerea okayama7\|eukprot:XP_001836590.2 hypothetical protein CC1G_06177 [Coprinopsis cinerea okayama7\